MENTYSLPPSPQNLTVIPRDFLLYALGNETRWRILCELAGGEPAGTRDLAPIVGCTPSGVYQHLAVLKEAGLVIQGRGYLYKILPQFLPVPGQRILDLGHCILRLDWKPAT
jgi:DNA-binding transcriptional ArsR family regulator